MKMFVIALLVAAPLPVMAAANPVDNSMTPSSATLGRTVAYFETASQRDPRDQEAWLNLAMAYRSMGRTAEAADAFRRVMALDNVVLQDRLGDDVWSHSLARTALAQTPRFSSR